MLRQEEDRYVEILMELSLVEGPEIMVWVVDRSADPSFFDIVSYRCRPLQGTYLPTAKQEEEKEATNQQRPHPNT
jgi:hypothetical protein